MSSDVSSKNSRSKRSSPKIIKVKNAYRLTPNMIRVVFAGPELAGIPLEHVGGNCKILLPDPQQSYDNFAQQINNGSKLTKRTYTVRAFRPEVLEMDIDFVAHGTDGPASRWAIAAKTGDFCGFAGPGVPKITEFYADWYLLAADPSGIPVVAATLESMPRDAIGYAIFEINSEADKQKIDAPEGIEIHWLIHPDPQQSSIAQETLLRKLNWMDGSVQTCIAGESGVVKSIRTFLHQEKSLPRSDTYVSGYWKIGLVEDEHQVLKRAEA